jgi:Protein of unknown function (DUF1761)
MSFEVLADLNWLAVIVGAIVFYVLGAVWFAPQVLGRAWQRASGIVQPEGERPGAAFYIWPFITSLVSTIATAMIALLTGTDVFGDALALGIVVGIGYAAAVALVGGIFDPHKPQPQVWFAIFGGYQVIGLTVVATIVALWE